MTMNESIVEDAALEWCGEVGQGGHWVWMFLGWT
jgi:hypothetical protein